LINAYPLRPRDSGCHSPLLGGHTVRTVREQGWSDLLNGELLRVAEEAGFEVLLTTDKNMVYQHSLKGRKIALVVLGKGRWPLIEPMVPQVVAAVNATKPGSHTVVDIPGK
jgi:hypothetical protein